jgi:hypothetical protein
MDWGKRRDNEWLAYFPDVGQTIDDATMIMGYYEPEHAAQAAVEYDWSSLSGWERGECEFKIIVISPAGLEFEFVGWNEPSVNHKVRFVKKAEAVEMAT